MNSTQFFILNLSNEIKEIQQNFLLNDEIE